MEEKLTCKICGKPIKGKGKTGMCKSCVRKAQNIMGSLGRKCEICGRPITDWNESGVCRHCWRGTGGNTNVPPKPKRVKVKCWNSHCRKEFYVRPDQHPKYSLCPACAAAKELMSRNGQWVQDVYFSNAAE